MTTPSAETSHAHVAYSKHNTEDVKTDPKKSREHNKLGPNFVIRLNQIYTCKYPHPRENAPKILPGNEERTSGTHL